MRYSSVKYDRLVHLILDDVENTELSLREIACKHQVSISFVSSRLKDYGIAHGRRAGTKIKPSQATEIIKRYAGGEHVSEIAASFDVTVATIYKRCQGATVVERRPRSVAVYNPQAPKLSNIVHINCKQGASQRAMVTARFLGVTTATFVSEAIEHYIKHLKS